jgi:hypothetical protein
MRAGIFAIGFCLVAAAANATPCKPGDPTGRYDGTAKSPAGTSLDVTLNIRCDSGQYAVRFYTSSGDFAGTEPAYANGHFTVKFDTQAALGSADLTPGPTSLSGTFEIAGDKGTMTLARTGDALAADAMTPRLDLTAAQWRDDLKAFAREMPKRHANAFFLLPREKFDEEITALDRKLDTLNGDEVFVGLQRIAKSIGDGHTGIGAPADRRVMPIEVTKFGDDFRVTAAGPGLEDTLGARIRQIGGMPIDDVWRRTLTLAPQGELKELREGDALIYLARGYALHGLDITKDRNHAVYALEGDRGRVFARDIQGLMPGEAAKMKSGFSDAALRFQHPGDPLWCKALPKDHAVYCAWHSYQGLDVLAKAMFALIDQTHPKKLVIDMRDNGGGDNTVGYAQLVQPLKARADINLRGHFFVLIGPFTFSAAMNNAAQFQDETRAILAGETIGEKPNSYQEPRQFRLPNSHLVVRASTLWYAFRKHGENAIRPDKEIIPSWADMKAGRDPVLDWVLAQH